MGIYRPYLSRFDVDKFYVIAFDADSDGSNGFAHKKEKTTDYAISVCGNYWLNVETKTQMAIGSVADKQTKITLTN